MKRAVVFSLLAYIASCGAPRTTAAQLTPIPSSPLSTAAPTTPTPNHTCADSCDGSDCGSLPCGLRWFFGTISGLAYCTYQRGNMCVCEVFECDFCGNGVRDGDEDCDDGGTCLGGTDAGRACTFGTCNGGYCQPRGGDECAENCSFERTVSTTFLSVSYPVVFPRSPYQLSGAITYVDGKPWRPPPPPCRPVSIRSFTPAPLVLPNGVCLCVMGVENALRYGPGNVGIGKIGCADAPNTLRADLTLQTWGVSSGCEPGHADQGADGQPCTADDPGRQGAEAVETQFACSGDCGDDGMVTVDDLVQGVNIALGNAEVYRCPSFDRDADFQVAVDELVGAVDNALGGCQVLVIANPPG